MRTETKLRWCCGGCRRLLLLAAAVALPRAIVNECTIFPLPLITHGHFAECVENATLQSALNGSGVCTVECNAGFQLEGVLPSCTVAGTFAPGNASCEDVNECLVPFTGGGCEQNCTNTEGGHTCDCAVGFELVDGRACMDVDECLSSPCQNGAFCNDTLESHGLDAYSCVCAAGYEGGNCETNVDECAPAPCQNGGFCVQDSPTIGSYRCLCPPGFEGDDCEINIDECMQSPCLNHGICLDGILEFSCICQAGYSGTTCETDIDECASMPCSNNATCVESLSSSILGADLFRCVCGAGFVGVLCEIDIDECSSSPCLNGGLCSDSVSVIPFGQYRCQCAVLGYSGEECQTNIDDCNSSPCQNGATCVDSSPPVAPLLYRCECATGFSSVECQADVGECATTSLATTQDGNCALDVDECRSRPCMNAATCWDSTTDQTVPVDAFRCACVPGYSGIICDFDVDECASDPCADSVCNQGVDVYGCGTPLKITLSFPSDLESAFASVENLKHKIVEEVATKLAVSDDRIKVISMTAGSLIVKLLVLPPMYANQSRLVEVASRLQILSELQIAGSQLLHFEAETTAMGCNPGYEGYDCADDVDECLSSPCVHGNCTESTVDPTVMPGAYVCSCESFLFGFGEFSDPNCDDASFGRFLWSKEDQFFHSWVIGAVSVVATLFLACCCFVTIRRRQRKIERNVGPPTELDVSENMMSIVGTSLASIERAPLVMESSSAAQTQVSSESAARVAFHGAGHGSVTPFAGTTDLERPADVAAAGAQDEGTLTPESNADEAIARDAREAKVNLLKQRLRQITGAVETGIYESEASNLGAGC